jgi:hypothetical protein
MYATSTDYSWVAWTLWSAILILIIFRVFFSYLKSRSQTKLAFQWDGKIIVGEEKADLPEEITAAMREENSPYVSSNEIVLWNAGLKTIHGSDIADADPLRITLHPYTRILRVLLRSKTNEANSFSATPDPEHPYQAHCTFDYLDPGDGVRLEVLQTNVNYGVAVKGTIHDLPNAISNWGRAPLCDAAGERPTRWARYSPYFYFALAILSILEQFTAIILRRHSPGWLFRRGKLGGLEFLFLPLYWAIWGITIGINELRRLQGRYPSSLSNV